LFHSLFNEPKASTLWATLTFWVLNKSIAITTRTDFHIISSRVKNLFGQFQLLFGFFDGIFAKTYKIKTP